MQEISVYDGNDELINNLVQWDKDVYIYIKEDGIKEAYSLHFFNPNSDSAYVVHSTFSNNTLVAKIPNVLLRTAVTIIGYVYKEGNPEQKSIYRFKIPIRAKPMPSNYAVEGTKDYINIEQVLAECKEWAKTSESWAIGGTGTRTGEDTNNSKYYSQQSKSSANTASTKASEAAASANAAKTSETNAKTSETNSKASETAAKTSETNAASSASTASTKATEATNSATESKSYATGGTGTRTNENIDNAKYYYEQSKSLVESFSGTLRPMGTVAFANLPVLSAASEGDMYNISNQFTTTANFKEGAGNVIPAGANVYKTADGKWDVLAGTPVTGVKGDAETSYRKGNVNITPEDIGAATSNHTHPTATQSAAGLMSADDKKKLDGVAASANSYSLPAATNTVRGGVKTGYTANGRNYPVQLADEKMYVNVPWTDNNTTYSNMTGATADAAGTAGLVPAPAKGNQGKYLRGDGTWQTPPDTNTTYSAASQSAAGLMSADDKKKLDGVASGANAYTHPATSGNKHIPAGGSSGQILRWSADGTAAWGADNNTTYSNMKGASASADGAAGLVPAPTKGNQAKYLRGDGTWQTPPDTNTTYSNATTTAAGLMSAADKTKLDGIATGANNYTYTLPAATSTVRGGVKTGYTANGRNYPVQLADEKMYVNVPWTDNNTTYSNMTAATASAAGTSGLVPAPAAGKQTSFLRGDGTWVVPTNTTYSNMTAATASAAGKAGLVPAPAAGAQGKYLRGDGTWQTPPDTNTTYSNATTTAAGLMSAADKTKLDGITGGTVATVTNGRQLILKNGKLSVTVPYTTGGKTVTISLWRCLTGTTYTFYGYDATSLDMEAGSISLSSLQCGSVTISCQLDSTGVLTLFSSTGETAACEYKYQVIWY